MRLPPFVTLALLLTAACGSSERRDGVDRPSASAPTPPQGPDAILIRAPRAGGVARAYVWPNVDSVVWRSASAVPAVRSVLAFDVENGLLSLVDGKGGAARVDLRLGRVNREKAKLGSLASADGWAVYGIGAKGEVVRLTPSGESWSWTPPTRARELFPQRDGTLLVAGERAGGTVLWRIRPPAALPLDSAVLPKLARPGAPTVQAGDRVYVTGADGLAGVRARDLQAAPPVEVEGALRALAATPSGDRLYLAHAGAEEVQVYDRYAERIAASIELPGQVAELRVDPLGRYLIARPQRGDSAWVVAVGTGRVVGTVRTRWMADLPLVAPDGGIVLATGEDVTIVDGETLRERNIVTGGVRDFWHIVLWNGFRARRGGGYEPPTFGGADTAADTAGAAPADSVAGDSAAATSDTTALPAPSGQAGQTAPAPPAPTPANPPAASPPAAATPRPEARPQPAPGAAAERRARGWYASFAAFPNEERARAIAGGIAGGGQRARIVTSTATGQTIYRVVLGPFPTRDDADRAARETRRGYWLFEETQ